MGRSRFQLVLGGICFLAIFVSVFVGCQKKKLKEKRPKSATSSSKKAVALSPREWGKKLVRKLGCYACHKIGGRGGSNGPDLSQVGKKYIQHYGSAAKAKEWFVLHLEDPKKYPGVGNRRYISARMPSYLKTTTKEERLAIAEYLLSLR